MLTVALQHCGLDPSFAIGGELTRSGSGAHHGTGRHLRRRGRRERRVVPSFPRTSRWSPTSSPTTSTTTAAARPTRGVRRVRRPDRARRLAGGLRRRSGRRRAGRPRAEARGRVRTLRRYGRTAARRAAADVPARGGGAPVALARPRGGAPLRLAVPGEHMVLNAMAALAAGVELGVAGAGAGRRAGRLHRGAPAIRVQGPRRRGAVYDDYAHHPTEVAAQLRAARACWPARGAAGRGVPAAPVLAHPGVRRAVRRPRSAWPTRSWCCDVYGAREEPEPGVSGALVADSGAVPRRARALRAALGGGARRWSPAWSAPATS